MAETKIFRAGVFSVVKHCYLPRAVAAHPRFELVVVTDDADQPDWVHKRNQKFADEFGIPYVRDLAKAIAEYDLDMRRSVLRPSGIVILLCARPMPGCT